MKAHLLLLAALLAITTGCGAARREPAALADCALQAAAQLYQVGLSTYQCIGAAPPIEAPAPPPTDPAEPEPGDDGAAE